MTRTFRTGIATFAGIVVVAASLAYVTAPPKGLDGYRERAASTAETLVSQVETARLWSRTYREGKAMPAATLVGFEEAAEDADAAATKFEGYEVPDGGEVYRRELATLAAEVTDALAQLRIAAQRERWDELAGRVAIKTKRPALALARARLGPRFALFGLIGSLLVTALLVMAELAGVALALQLATSINYLLWVPVTTFLVLIVLWRLSFETMERLYGMLGLAMLVFVVAVFHLDPNWSELVESSTTIAPTASESWATYLFFIVTLIGAQMTPYEMFFFSSGAVEHRWKPKDLKEMRANVIIGFPLGGLLAVAIQACAFLVFFEPGITVEHISQTALPVAVALGKVGLIVAIVGIFAATFGATLETLFASSYDVAQYFGWSYGKVQSPARASRFTTTMLAMLFGAAALALTTINPITVTIVAVVCSAALLPFLFLPVLLVANDRELMGEMANGRLSNFVGTATLAVSCLVSVLAFPLLILTKGGTI